jgi:hypothetical protein
MTVVPAPKNRTITPRMNAIEPETGAGRRGDTAQRDEFAGEDCSTEKEDRIATGS